MQLLLLCHFQTADPADALPGTGTRAAAFASGWIRRERAMPSAGPGGEARALPAAALPVLGLLVLAGVLQPGWPLVRQRSEYLELGVT